MKFLKIWLALELLVLFTPGAFGGDSPWVEVRSPNFSVITDAGDKRGRDVALHFEQMRSVFGALMTKAHVSLPVPLQIVAFRSSREMRLMAPIFNGKPTEEAGMFQGGTDRSFIMLDMSVENPWYVVFHEYAHQLMNGNMSKPTDPWFEEGFAEYFASIEVDSKQASVGKIPEDTYRILQSEGMMRVADLFRVQQYSRTYNESGSHRNVFYAESSLVVHYLYDNHLIPKAAEYFALHRDDKKPVDQAFEQAFGMTPDQFDKLLRGYLTGGRFKYYPIPTPANIVPAQFTVTPVSVADARALLADIHAHSPDYKDKALAEFQDVLKNDPDNAAALRGAGFASLQEKDYQRAGEYLRRATQLDSKDARVHFYYAMVLNQQGPPDAAKSAEIEKELETSISLDPTLADAYSLLGFTQAFSGEPEKGIASMKKGLELSPRDEHYMINLASVYMAARRVDEAIAVLRSLAASGDPEVAALANRNLDQALNYKKQVEQFQTRVTDPVVARPAAHGRDDVQLSSQNVVPGAVPAGATHFIKGKLVAVDCSAAPQAVLTVAWAATSMKFHVRDSAHLVLIGADEFSCGWKNKNVAVNYRERSDGEGDLVSLEMQ
ncbi:MAG: tetratricopeptide repeat protein [Terriglobales bacterium]